METTLNHKDVWRGEYRNVDFEIVKWRLGGNVEGSHPCWNYYIFLPIEQIPTELHKYFILKGEYRKISPDGQEHLFYDYYTPYLNDLEFHGGITFYAKINNGEGKLIGIKIGCDYAHSFDERAGYSYTIEYVLAETKNSIDKLHEIIPNLKVCCRWDGKYYDKSECEELPQGGYLANKNKKAWYNARQPKG